MKADNFFSGEMKKMRLKMFLLIRIRSEKAYPYALIKELSTSGFAKFYGAGLKNDIYNTLNALEKNGYIKFLSRVEKGRAKKYYILTDKGKKSLSQAKRIFMHTAKEVFKLFGDLNG